jgi:hypothetical protein
MLLMTLRIPILLLFSVQHTCLLLIYFIVAVIVSVVVKNIFTLYNHIGIVLILCSVFFIACAVLCAVFCLSAVCYFV